MRCSKKGGLPAVTTLYQPPEFHFTGGTSPLFQATAIIIVIIFTMKPSSPLSLVLFIYLTTAAPIPITIHTSLLLLEGCHNLASCPPTLRKLVNFSSSKINNLPPPACSPESKLFPHFPSHQLSLPPASDFSDSSDSSYANMFNNAPQTPPSNLSPSQALTSKAPLESKYLLSLLTAAP